MNTYAYVGGNPVNNIDMNGLAWFRPQGHKFYVGREGVKGFEPGKGITGFLEDYVPAMHDMGILHDSLVGHLQKAGYPDPLINVPTMLRAYQAAFLANLYGDGFSIATECR